MIEQTIHAIISSVTPNVYPIQTSDNAELPLLLYTVKDLAP